MPAAAPDDPDAGPGDDGPGAGNDEGSDEGSDEAPDQEQSGLGRGLAAIIPTLAADLDASPARPRRTRRRGGVAAFLAAPAPDAGSVPPSGVAAGGDTGGARAAGPDDEPSAPDEALPADPMGASTEPPEPVQQVLLADTGTPPLPSSVQALRDDLVGSLLDGIGNTLAVDVCGYLHQGRGEPPRLFLRAPSLDAVGPTRAFALLDALRRGLESGRSQADLRVAGFHLVTVATAGVGGNGLWALGRDEPVPAAEAEVVERFCRSFGRAVHQLDGAGVLVPARHPLVRVQAHRARDSVLAEVEVRLGDRILPGHARADTGVEAVTRAVVDAAGRPATFRYASEVAREGEHAAVVLLEGPDHDIALGSACVREGGEPATALAALRAVEGLG